MVSAKILTEEMRTVITRCACAAFEHDLMIFLGQLQTLRANMERFPYKDKYLTFGYFRALNSFQVHSAFAQLARVERVAGNEFL